MKNILKYAVIALVVFALTSVLHLDGMAKTFVSKGFFIAASAADKFMAEGDMQKWSSKKLMKIVCKLPKYIAEGLV
jgi:hypothetical protein